MGEDRIYTVNEVLDALEQLDGRTIRIAGALNIEFEGDAIRHIPKAERRDDDFPALLAAFDFGTLGVDRDGLSQFASRHVVVEVTVVRRYREVEWQTGLWYGGVVIHAITKFERR